MAEEMTGYATEDRYWASRYIQGNRTVYSLDLSLATVAATMPRPNPDKASLGNRPVRESHARGFGKYVRENETWVAPSLILRAPDIFDFEMREKVEGTEFGILSLPRLARTDLKILDGQHRILGLCFAVEELSEELEETRSQMADAHRQQNTELVEHFRAKKKELDDQRSRFDRERISIDIHIEDATKRVQQMFSDITNNAQGINYAIRVRFDYRKVANRALDDVLKHPLLKDRVDMERDRLGGTNPNLLGAKHVADIIRTLAVGIGGRISRRQESEISEKDLVETSKTFFDVLVRSFPELKSIADGNLAPEKFRKESLLASTTILRVLAGVFHELTQDDNASIDDVQQFFSALAPTMPAPVTKDSPWMKTGLFREGAMAPTTAGQRDVNSLTRTIVSWAKNRPRWLQEEAA